MTQTALVDEAAEVVTLADQPAWLAARVQGIGASEAPMVLGVSPYKSALQLFAEKLQLVEPAPLESEAMQWGLLLQPLLVTRYTQVTGRPTVPEPAWTLRRSRTHAFMVASLDATVQIDGAADWVPLEIKTVGGYKADEWAEAPPLHVQVQVQHQLAVTGAARGSVAALIGGHRFVWSDVARNDRFIEIMIAKEQEFWRRLLDRDPPPVDATEASRDLLKALYPEETPGLVVNLPAACVAWDEQRTQALALDKQAKAMRLEAENHLREALGEAESGVLPTGAIYTLKTVQRAGYVVESTQYREMRRREPKGRTP